MVTLAYAEKLNRKRRPVFRKDFLRGDITPVLGGAPTYTRSGNAYVWDHENCLRTILANESPIEGARRVRNQFANSSNFGGSGWTQNGGSSSVTTSTDAPPGFSGSNELTSTSPSSFGYYQSGTGQTLNRTYVLVCTYRIIQAGGSGISPVLYVGGAAQWTGPVEGAGDWKTIAAKLTCLNDALSPAISFDQASTGTVIVRVAGTMMLDVTGLANQNPESYIDSNINYGAAVNGVKYFATTNGNTYDETTGIVTFASGAPLTTVKGVLVEATETNGFSQPRDLSNAAWDITTGVPTAAKTQTGVDGAASACTLLTKDTANTLHWRADTQSYANGTTITMLACIGKTSTSAYAYLGCLQRDGTTYNRGYLNVATGALGTVDSGTYSYVRDRGLWWEFYVSCSVGTGASAPICGVGFADADNTPTFTGTATTLIVDAMKVAAGERVYSSPIIATGNATRNTPSFSYPAPTPLSTSGATFTYVLEFTAGALSTAGTRVCQVTLDGSNYWFIGITAAKIWAYAVSAAYPAGQALNWTTTPAAGTVYRCVLRVSSTDVELWVNGSSRASSINMNASNWPRHGTLLLSQTLGASNARTIDCFDSALSADRCAALSVVGAPV